MFLDKKVIVILLCLASHTLQASEKREQKRDQFDRKLAYRKPWIDHRSEEEIKRDRMQVAMAIAIHDVLFGFDPDEWDKPEMVVREASGNFSAGTIKAHI